MIRHTNASFSYKPEYSFPAFFSRPAIYKPIGTDENHAVINYQTTRTAFCNYLATEVEALEDRDFQAVRNQAVKLLCSIQSREE